MPATSGRVRMPHNNRVHGSSALTMTGIWKNTIGYDPYAAEDESLAEGQENVYEQAQGLMELVKMSTRGVSENRGLCRKCGLSGHLPFQCRNHIKVKLPHELGENSSSEESGDELLVGLRQEEEEKDEEDDISLSDASSVSIAISDKAERKKKKKRSKKHSRSETNEETRERKRQRIHKKSQKNKKKKKKADKRKRRG